MTDLLLKNVLIFCLAMFVNTQALPGQIIYTTSKYGLQVIEKKKSYKQLVERDGQQELVDVKALVPEAIIDVRYATKNNLIGQKVYPRAEVFLRKPAALALQSVNERLKSQGYGLVLHDGYRPYAVTELFYEKIQDTTYVADPRKGSRHNRGMAIDLSMYALVTKQEVSMPSAYDETTERAWHTFENTSEESKYHRDLLKKAMLEAGFEIYVWEWWHYDFQGWQQCPVFNISHRKIKKANRELHKK